MLGAALLAGATCALLLACIWGGDRYAWVSAAIVGLFAATAALAVGLVVRERRAADPIVPLDLLRTRVVAVASAAFFFVTATLFAITVFVPLFLQVTTGATPTQAGLLLVPMMIGITLSTNLAGRAVSRTGRLKRFPVAGLSLMTGALVLLAIVVGDPSQVTTSIGLAVFGLGFGMTGQMLTVAVQNGVDRRRLGVAMARPRSCAASAARSAPPPSARSSPRASARARRTAPTSSTPSRPSSSSRRRWRRSPC